MTSKSVPPPDVTAGDLAPYLQGLYECVSRKLGCAPSYVVRVALGQSKSQTVESALERELADIVERIKKDRLDRERA